MKTNDWVRLWQAMVLFQSCGVMPPSAAARPSAAQTWSDVGRRQVVEAAERIVRGE
jgi:hypothetical protein